MRRIGGVAALVLGLLLAGPIALGFGGGIAFAHAQLISSAPGSSEVLGTSPPEVRLAFSEPIEAEYTSFIVLDEEGNTISPKLGAPDAEDPYGLFAAIDTLPIGGYSISWQALSAADGHTTNGFFNFSIGANLPGQVHNLAGHGVDAQGVNHLAPPLVANPIEITGRAVGYLGLLLAFGLLPVGWLVVRPGYGRTPRTLAVGMAVALAIGTLGGLILSTRVATNAELEVPTYLRESRTGVLLAWRLMVGALATFAVIGFIVLRRPTIALAVGSIGAGIGLVLLAFSGHASAFSSPGPMAAMLVHLAAAGVWVAGIVVLIVLAIRREHPPMRVLIPRFSALALLSIGLLAATGIYADWVQTRDVLSVATDYQLTLAAKIVVVFGALALGGLNFLDAGQGLRRLGRLGSFRLRIGAEVMLAAMVLLVTANLGSGFPPASQRPIPIQESVSSAAIEVTRTVALDVGPARPGLNRFIVTVDPAPPDFTAVTAVLARLDSGSGDTRIYLLPAGDDPTKRIFFKDGGLLARNSRWEATIEVTDSNGAEIAHARYEFALDQNGIIEGKKVPPLDPGLALGFLLLSLGLLGGVYAVAGGTLPRVHAATGRLALAGGGAIGSLIGVVLVIWGAKI